MCFIKTANYFIQISGQRDATKFLLNLGVAAAVYDDQGNSAVSLMIEKMPDLVVQALDQFIVEDKPNRKIYFYLCSLEYSVSCKFGLTPARSVLEVTNKVVQLYPLIYNLKIQLKKLSHCKRDAWKGWKFAIHNAIAIYPLL